MSTLILGFLAFILTAATPGPSTLAIMATSLAHGRAAGLRFAAGIVTGSCFWGLLAALGLGAILATVGWALMVLKLAGGAYLIWLAIKAARSAMRATPPTEGEARVPRRLWAQGLALHLTNPKAVLGWSAVIAVGLPSGAGPAHIAPLLSGCAALAVAINLGYAIVFSTPSAIAAYSRVRRAVDGTVAVLFAGAGIGLLAWRP